MHIPSGAPFVPAVCSLRCRVVPLYGALLSILRFGGIVAGVVRRCSSLQVVSPTRIVLFVKNSFSFQRRGETLKLVLKLVAVDTGAGAVQLNREGGGVVIGKLSTKRRENSRRKSEARKARKRDSL